MDFLNFTNEYVDIIYIDLLGSFFGYLLKLETQKEATTTTFINWFKNSNLVVVVDGVPTLQKAKTATNRTLTKMKEFEKFKKQST